MRRKKRTGTTVTTSAEARYTSGSNTVTITKAHLYEPTPSKPISHPPAKPYMKGHSSRPTRTVEAPPPSRISHSTPSYNRQAFNVDYHTYNIPGMAVRDKKELVEEQYDECI